jgi:hypothetical protein
MFEPRRLTVEEAQWRLSCGWYVDCRALEPAPTTVFPCAEGLGIRCSNKRQQANKRAFLRANCLGSSKFQSLTQSAAAGGAGYESVELTVFSLKNQ